MWQLIYKESGDIIFQSPNKAEVIVEAVKRGFLIKIGRRHRLSFKVKIVSTDANHSVHTSD